ncbi:type I methionyl aminopeptidase [Candidatus Gracilibacteria bacterium]|nr:type I methionyl aminopeptidase [Candidatus Gracilibacteria bacterium]
MDNLIKTKQQIDNIRQSGAYLTELLIMLRDYSRAGIALIELEIIAEEFMKKNKVKGAFKGYQGFPANLCLSVNNCIVHGIPDDYVLKNGDLLKIDCGVNYKGGISDAAISVLIGGEMTNPNAWELIQATKNALDEGIKKIISGKKIYDYSRTVNDEIKKSGFKVIKKLTGHGVGNAVHERPYIYNRPHPDTQKIDFKSGMVIALEPITAISSDDFVEGGNGRNLYTKNGDLGAQREYTVVVTDKGCEILAGIQQINN